MRCYDSSFVIDYLSGDERTIQYLEANASEQHFLPAIVLYEALQGEVRSAGSPEFAQVRGHLDWAEIAQFDEATAVAAGQLLDTLASEGRTLASADAMIAGTASSLGATLVTDDDDFTNETVRSVLDVETY